ncbi:hypothetical protein jhhlp_002120 [Lomentospora prolificans]|uniref:Protein PNS1 n=1 Tax=Lomentospora prolificans TaxID=41688 RepID=A0A2N3ND63_9PEZI|nr:hypothetical protein jhhlp_002120 [Lomentospora prolificans]
MAQSRGEAADYYQQGGNGYGAGPQMQYQQQPYGGGQPQYQQYPPPQNQSSQYTPQYGQNGKNNAPPPPYGYQPPEAVGDATYTFDQAFKVDKPKWNDLWAGILFLIFVAGFTAVSGIAIRGYATTKGTNGDGIYDGNNNFGLDTNTLILFLFCLAVALIFGYGYVWLIRIWPKQFIWLTLILNVVFAFVTGIYMLSRRSWGGLLYLLLGLFLIFVYWSWRKRIPFSVLMLTTSIDVAKKYGHVYLVSFLGGIVAIAFAAWYGVTVVAIFARWSTGNNPACVSKGDCSDGKVAGLIVFCTFTMYWMSEWLKNTLHATISGVYGSWYYSSRAFPKNATRGAFKRSMTYSFGSISLGSLFVAIINFLRQLCSMAYQSQASEGDLISMCIICCLQCILGLVQWAVEFVNRYAFSYIALFGKAYFPAAKATWKLIKDRGIDALVNECLVGPVLTFGALFVAYACSLLAYLYLIFTKPAYNDDGNYTAVILLFSFLIGLQIANIFTTPISSGIDTIFVAAAWDPEVLMRDHPELYEAFVRVYPQIQTAIHA